MVKQDNADWLPPFKSSMAKWAANSKAKLYAGLAPMPMTVQAGAATPWSPFRNRSLLSKADLVLTSVTHKMS